MFYIDVAHLALPATQPRNPHRKKWNGRETQSWQYLSLGKYNENYSAAGVPEFANLNQYRKEVLGRNDGPRTPKRDWHEPVQDAIARSGHPFAGRIEAEAEQERREKPGHSRSRPQ